MTFWHDPDLYPWIRTTDLWIDPALVVSGFQDANKKYVFFAFYFLKIHLYQFLKKSGSGSTTLVIIYIHYEVINQERNYIENFCPSRDLGKILRVIYFPDVYGFAAALRTATFEG